MTAEEGACLHTLAKDDSGALLKVFEHHCRYETTQAASADAVVHVFEQLVQTITNEVMAKIRVAMRDTVVVPAPRLQH